jgi:hypothetical protein
MDADIPTQKAKNETITGRWREQLPPKDPSHEIRTPGEPIAVDVQPMVTEQQRR